MYTGTGRQIVANHINAPVPELGEVAPDISEDLEDLIYDLLEKNPEDRPANAQVVATRLDDMRKRALLESRKPAVRPTTLPPRIRRRRRRR
jgi:serine/threonine-protein kinase